MTKSYFQSKSSVQKLATVLCFTLAIFLSLEARLAHAADGQQSKSATQSKFAAKNVAKSFDKNVDKSVHKPAPASTLNDGLKTASPLINNGPNSQSGQSSQPNSKLPIKATASPGSIRSQSQSLNATPQPAPRHLLLGSIKHKKPHGLKGLLKEEFDGPIHGVTTDNKDF